MEFVAICRDSPRVWIAKVLWSGLVLQTVLVVIVTNPKLIKKYKKYAVLSININHKAAGQHQQEENQLWENIIYMQSIC